MRRACRARTLLTRWYCKDMTVVRKQRTRTTLGDPITVDATLTTKGQLTLPAPVREAMGVSAGDRVRFTAGENGAFVATAIRRRDILDAAGALVGAKPLGAVGMPELRRRAALGRARKLAAQR